MLFDIQFQTRTLKQKMKRFTRTQYGSTTARISARASERASRRSSALASRRFAVPYSIKPEFKSVDTDLAGAGNTTPTAIYLLNGLVPGTGSAQRIGRQVIIKSLELRFSFSGGAADSFWRYIVVLDKQANGAAPAITDLLVANALYSPKNLTYVRRFTILLDEIGSVETQATSESMKTFEKYKRINYVTEFNAGATGTVTDIATGSLYMFVFGSNAAGGNAFAISGSARLRFTDV